MMGATHFATGALAGSAIFAAAGASPPLIIAGSVLTGGAALVPDLDHRNSCPTLAIPPVTRWAADGIRSASAWAYERTATDYERRSTNEREPGKHRYLTHTLTFSIGLGVLAYFAGEFLAVRVLLSLVLVAFAIRGAAQKIAVFRPLDKPMPRLVTSAALGCYLGWAIEPYQLAVALSAGCVVHILGDMMTKSGVPLWWPYAIKGKRWWKVRTPGAITTGESRVEPALRWVCLLGTPVCGVWFGL
jgi:membrane-bound metal-dependent hydrolase YbcI (DUF457 family)